MPKLDEIYVRKKEASGQVSAQTRSLALGYLAVSWALLTAHDEPLRSMAANVSRPLVVLLAAGSFLVLFCDFWQYLAITSMSKAAALQAEQAEQQVALYNEDSFAFRAQAFLYQAKIWIVIGTTMILVAIFLCLLLPVQVPTCALQEQKYQPVTGSCLHSAAVK